jgi:serine/threonine protein kinase
MQSTTHSTPQPIGAAQCDTIFLAHDDEELGCGAVIIKQISLARMKEMQKTGKTLENPLQEVQVASKIIAAGQHDYVVRFLETDVDDEYLYLKMEYCTGGDLLTCIQRQPETFITLGESDAVLAVRQIALGLDFLHHIIGVAHRDVSLENVFVHHGVLVLGDFGLSISVSERPSTTVKKLCYMAPEVVTGRAYGPRLADIGSLGVLFVILHIGSPLLEVASSANSAFRTFCFVGLRCVLQSWGMVDRF